MANALELTGVFQHVGQRCALAAIDLRVPRGAWLLLVGRNGAGKSLLTRLILGLDAPSAGTVRVLGQDLQRLGARAMTALRGRLGAVLQGGACWRTAASSRTWSCRCAPGPAGGRTMARAARLVIATLRLDGLENHHAALALTGAAAPGRIGPGADPPAGPAGLGWTERRAGPGRRP